MTPTHLTHHMDTVDYPWSALTHCHIAEEKLQHGDWHQLLLMPALGLHVVIPQAITPQVILHWQLDMEKGVLRLHGRGAAQYADACTTEDIGQGSATEFALCRMYGTLADAHAFIETRILSRDDNWVLRRWNERPTDLLRLFLFWMAWIQLEDEPLARRLLENCMADVAPEIELEWLMAHDPCRVFSAFIWNLHRGRNMVVAIEEYLSERPVVH